MTDYTLMFRIKVREGDAARFLEIMRFIAEQTVREPGNLVFEVRKESSDPDTFICFHSYRDREAFDLHYNASYHVDNIPALREVIWEIETIELQSVGFNAVSLRAECAVPH